MDWGPGFCMLECSESSQQPCEVRSIIPFTEEETDLERLTPRLYLASKWQSRVSVQAVWLRVHTLIIPASRQKKTGFILCGEAFILVKRMKLMLFRNKVYTSNTLIRKCWFLSTGERFCLNILWNFVYILLQKSKSQKA